MRQVFGLSERKQKLHDIIKSPSPAQGFQLFYDFYPTLFIEYDYSRYNVGINWILYK